MSGNALREARRRMEPPPAHDRIAQHLESAHGIKVAGLTALDLGVYRVDRHDGPAWVARVFSTARPHAAVSGDAQVLDLLADHHFSAERRARPETLSVLAGHTVLVTEHVQGVPQSDRRDAIRASGGLRRLGEMLGELQTMTPAGALARPGGGWHHLVDGSPQEEIAAARALLDDCADVVAEPDVVHYEALKRDLAGVDGGDGLPQAVVHPDFVLANVIASPERGMVVVDWAGTGTAPRTWSLAFLLWAEAARNVARVDLVAAGYRRRVRLEPEELQPDRLEAMMRARPTVLAAWSFCLGRQSAENAARHAAAARDIAATASPRAVAALAGQAS